MPDSVGAKGLRLFGLPLLVYLLLLASQSLLWFLWWRAEPGIAEENGVMENLQAVLLVLGAILLANSAWRAYPGTSWIFLAGLVLLYFTFAMLEVDTRDYDLPRLNFILHGKVRNVWLGALWAALAILAVRQARSLWTFFTRWLPTHFGIVLSVAGVFWLASRLTEKLELMSGSFFLEEILEINASLLMFIVALTARKWASHGVAAAQNATT